LGRSGGKISESHFAVRGWHETGSFGRTGVNVFINAREKNKQETERTKKGDNGFWGS